MCHSVSRNEDMRLKHQYNRIALKRSREIFDTGKELNCPYANVYRSPETLWHIRFQNRPVRGGS